MRRARGTIQVFTFKEGLLSAVAHDLRFHIEQFTVMLDGSDVDGEFDLKTLHLDGPVRQGIVHPEDYDARNRADVEKTMHRDVLRTDLHPLARFTGRAVPDGTGFAVQGELELAGRKAPLSFVVRVEGGSYRASIDLVPSRWGIAEYRGLFGAIRLKDKVRIELALTDA